MDRFGDIIVNNYNATEAGMIASATPEDLRAAPDTAGKAVPGTEIRILDDDHHDLPTNQIGQIFVRSGTLFEGYSTGAAKRFHEGFMASGDMGYLDANGRLFVVGRDDEMIVSGGENVYPIEVEKVLAGHPDVADAAVIGVDDDQYGQRLAAFVALSPGTSAAPEVLKQHVRERLANYKVPRDVVRTRRAAPQCHRQDRARPVAALAGQPLISSPAPGPWPSAPRSAGLVVLPRRVIR